MSSLLPRLRVSSAVLTGLAFVFVLAIQPAIGQRAIGRIIPGRPGTVGPGGVVNLPYFVQDNKGNQWRVYQGGWLQQQGNMPLYSQGAQITINGSQPNMNNNQGRMDPKTGELVLENLNAQNGLVVTRRIFIDKDQALVRYVDVIKNTGNQPVQAQIQIQTNVNYGIQNSQVIPDPKRKGQELAWVAQTGGGASVMEIYGGKGAKSVFNINPQGNNNYVQAMINPTIPAGKEVALMHMHAVVASVDAGAQFVKNMRESQILKSVPKELRKILINFTGGQAFIGDIEILRGELLDVVEVKGGDQYKGTLKEPSFSLQTFYGKVDLPVDQVIGVINVGRYRPRQLVVTTDGQIFGGKLAKDTIDLELSSKQVIKVPLTQITRVGYRKRSGEPEEWTFDKPIVLMRSGERVGIKLPTEPVSVVTRYGRLTIKPDTIAAILLQTEDSGVHEVMLTDGSKFAGLLDATSFPMTLDNGSDQKVTFPASSVARMIFTNKLADGADDDDRASLTMANDDVLVGTLGGKLAVDTAFDTISINASEIKSLTHPTPGSLDVSVTLWDGTTLSGQLQDQELSCKLASGLDVKVPVALLSEYQQPSPAPADQMVDRIKATVKELNAEDWKVRDHAEATLVAMGPVAFGVLKELRSAQPPEAQQRIDSVIKELEKQRDSAPKATSGPKPGTGPAPEPAIELQIDN
jgi:hypothetical protein